ncbi:MAG: catechol 2,3-dioxygenase-like lactoylglutathione lyase family enzyme [Bacteriovoracaceae bacterium]|jgi:lactoylglutathione lyase
MLKVNGIDHININVKNLNKSIEFYQSVFGFKVMEKGISTMSGAPYAIIGVSKKAMLAIYESKDLLPATRLNHLGFNIENFEEISEIAKKFKIKVANYGLVEYPNSKSIYIFDPDDNEIELSSVFTGGL